MPEALFNTYEEHKKKGSTLEEYSQIFKVLQKTTKCPLTLLTMLLAEYPQEMAKLRDPVKLQSALSNRHYSRH